MGINRQQILKLNGQIIEKWLNRLSTRSGKDQSN